MLTVLIYAHCFYICSLLLICAHCFYIYVAWSVSSWLLSSSVDPL
jgi:hypothetical protein